VAEDEGSKAALWTFIGMGVGFKVITSIIIFVMEPTVASAAFLVAMQWYWLLLPLPFVAVPAVFWYRLWRVRRRRRQLIRSEWAVESEADWNPTSARGTM
jgi:hypothetical protein